MKRTEDDFFKKVTGFDPKLFPIAERILIEGTCLHRLSISTQPRRAMVVSLYHGLQDGQPRSFEDVGKVVPRAPNASKHQTGPITTERIRQMYQSAIRACMFHYRIETPTLVKLRAEREEQERIEWERQAPERERAEKRRLALIKARQELDRRRFIRKYGDQGFVDVAAHAAFREKYTEALNRLDQAKYRTEKIREEMATRASMIERAVHDINRLQLAIEQHEKRIVELTGNMGEAAEHRRELQNQCDELKKALITLGNKTNVPTIKHHISRMHFHFEARP